MHLPGGPLRRADKPAKRSPPHSTTWAVSGYPRLTRTDGGAMTNPGPHHPRRAPLPDAGLSSIGFLTTQPPSRDTAGPPTLAHDLSTLAWLEAYSTQLSPDCTDYICSALLEWAMLGELWPEPTLRDDSGSHLDQLELITQRLQQQLPQIDPLERRLQLARAGRELRAAASAHRAATGRSPAAHDPADRAGSRGEDRRSRHSDDT